MKRIVVVEPIHADGLALLRGDPGVEIVALGVGAPEAELSAALEGAAGVLVRTRPLTADLLARAPALEVVSKHGVGCDNIAVDHLTARGVPVTIAADANAVSVAEHTLTLMLACAKRLFEQDAGARTADWSYRQRTGAWELSGKTVLIIGLGRIGRRVARLCEAFGMRVLGYDLAGAPEGVASVADLDAGLAEADVVTVHVPLVDGTRNLLDAARFARMKPGAVLINCARGGVVAEAPLIERLRAGALAAYGTDVFETEPLRADEPLFGAPNVIVTAHTAAMTAEAKRAMAMQSAENALSGLRGALRPDVVINAEGLAARG